MMGMRRARVAKRARRARRCQGRLFRALGLVATKGRRPSGILTIILKKYWSGLYRTSPDAPQKLALKWEDYHAAPYGVFTTTQDGRQCVPTCGQVVLMTFWEHYKVSADTDQWEATNVLELMAKKNLRDIFYHTRKLAILHYFAEQGERRNKDRVIAENLTIEDAAGWERICPTWCLNKKDSWSALVTFWTEDEEFKAKSIQNKANRGKGGTHNQGNKPFPIYEKDMVAANGGQEIPRLQVWQTAHKKKDLVEGKVVYYGKTEESVESYKKAFKSLRGEDSDPLLEPLDEMAAMISGAFLGSEDWCSAARVCGTCSGTTVAKDATKMEFLAQLYGGTPGSSTQSNNSFGCAAASSPHASPAERDSASPWRSESWSLRRHLAPSREP
ncbi:hypothetical protein ACQ4PT_025956 [Festuca glaucescens]